MKTTLTISIIFFITLITQVSSDASEDESSDVVSKIKLRGKPKGDTNLCNFFKEDVELFNKCKTYVLTQANNETLNNETSKLKTSKKFVAKEMVKNSTKFVDKEIGSTKSTSKATTKSPKKSTTLSTEFSTTERVASTKIGKSSTKSKLSTDDETSTSGSVFETTTDSLISESSVSESTTAENSQPDNSPITDASPTEESASSLSTFENSISSVSEDSSFSTSQSTEDKETSNTVSTDTATTDSLSSISTIAEDEIRSTVDPSNLHELSTFNITNGIKFESLLNKSLDVIEKEIEEANIGQTALVVFDGQKLKNCSNLAHPISQITIWMMKQGITKEYFDNICKTNYHDACEDTWKSCSAKGPNIFCTKNCSPTECPLFKAFGYDENDQPNYLDEVCADDPKFKCQYLRESGDCLAIAKGIAKICPKTCNFCKSSKEFLPFMPEHHKMTLWLHKYENGKYRRFAEFVWRKLDEIQEKIILKQC